MTRPGGAALPIAGVSLLTLAMLGVAVIAGAATPSDSARVDGLALDIPPAYLAAYQAGRRSLQARRQTAGRYLAAIGEVESRSRTLERAGRPLRPERPRLLRGPDADPQRLRQRRRNLGRASRSTATATAARTSTTRTTRSPLRRTTCARPARPATGARRSSRTTTSGAYVEPGPRAARPRTASGGRSAPATVVRGRIGRWLAPTSWLPRRAMRRPDRRRTS